MEFIFAFAWLDVARSHISPPKSRRETYSTNLDYSFKDVTHPMIRADSLTFSITFPHLVSSVTKIPRMSRSTNSEHQ